jgi:hypothetical protein
MQQLGLSAAGVPGAINDIMFVCIFITARLLSEGQGNRCLIATRKRKLFFTLQPSSNYSFRTKVSISVTGRGGL